jgi:carbon storage regulator CsrA
MLVLTRKLQQQIKIGEQITVTVLRIKGNTVRVGIQAPREVRVVRGELPKDAAGKEVATEHDESAVEAVFSIDAELEPVGEVAAEAAGESVIAALDLPNTAGETPAPLSASHLPLRRIRNGHGAGPLKQVIASCATLAK